jgi:transposase
MGRPGRFCLLIHVRSAPKFKLQNWNLRITRNLVERFFNRIKLCRRIATRSNMLAANYLAFIRLASIRLWLRIHESTT